MLGIKQLLRDELPDRIAVEGMADYEQIDQDQMISERLPGDLRIGAYLFSCIDTETGGELRVAVLPGKKIMLSPPPEEMGEDFATTVQDALTDFAVSVRQEK